MQAARKTLLLLGVLFASAAPAANAEPLATGEPAARAGPAAMPGPAATGGPAVVPGPAPELARTIVDACTRTANAYAFARDRLDYAAYGELFTADAAFDLSGTGLGGRTVGREAIVQALRERGPATVTRHFSSVVHMEATDASRARGVSYVLLYALPSVAVETGQNAIEEPFVVGEYHDTFEYEGGRCRISERQVRIVFQGSERAAGHAPAPGQRP